jgi:hypothetical protein
MEKLEKEQRARLMQQHAPIPMGGALPSMPPMPMTPPPGYQPSAVPTPAKGGWDKQLLGGSFAEAAGQQLNKYMPTTTLPGTTGYGPATVAKQAIRGTVKGTTEMADAAQTPKGLAMLAGITAATAFPVPLVMALVKGGLGAAGIMGLAETAPEAVSAFSHGDVEGGSALLTQGAASIGMTLPALQSLGVKAPNIAGGIQKLMATPEEGFTTVDFLTGGGKLLNTERYLGTGKTSTGSLAEAPGKAVVSARFKPDAPEEIVSALNSVREKGIDPLQAEYRITDPQSGKEMVVDFNKFAETYPDEVNAWAGSQRGAGAEPAIPPPAPMLSPEELAARTSAPEYYNYGAGQPRRGLITNKMKLERRQEVAARRAQEEAAAKTVEEKERLKQQNAAVKANELAGKEQIEAEGLAPAAPTAPATPAAAGPEPSMNHINQLLDIYEQTKNPEILRAIRSLVQGGLKAEPAAPIKPIAPTPAKAPVKAPTPTQPEGEVDVDALIKEVDAQLASGELEPIKGEGEALPSKGAGTQLSRVGKTPAQADAEAHQLFLEKSGRTITQGGKKIRQPMAEVGHLEDYKTPQEMFDAMQQGIEFEVNRQGLGKAPSTRGKLIPYMEGDKFSGVFHFLPEKSGGKTFNVALQDMKLDVNRSTANKRVYTVKRGAQYLDEVEMPSGRKGYIKEPLEFTKEQVDAEVADLTAKAKAGDQDAAEELELIKQNRNEDGSLTKYDVVKMKGGQVGGFGAQGKMTHPGSRKVDSGELGRKIIEGQAGEVQGGTAFKRPVKTFEERQAELEEAITTIETGLSRKLPPEAEAKLQQALKKKQEELRNVESGISAERQASAERGELMYASQLKEIARELEPSVREPVSRTISPQRQAAEASAAAGISKTLKVTKARKNAAGEWEEYEDVVTPAAPGREISQEGISAEAIAKAQGFKPPDPKTQAEADAKMLQLKQEHEGAVKTVSILKKQGRDTADAVQRVKEITADMQHLKDIRSGLEPEAVEKPVGGQEQKDISKMPERQAAPPTKTPTSMTAQYTRDTQRLAAIKAKLKGINPGTPIGKKLTAEAKELEARLAPKSSAKLTEPPPTKGYTAPKAIPPGISKSPRGIQVWSERQASLAKRAGRKPPMPLTPEDLKAQTPEGFSYIEWAKENAPDMLKAAAAKTSAPSIPPIPKQVTASPEGSSLDTWTLKHPDGGSMEVRFTDDGVYIEQVRVPKESQRKGIASQMYEKLGRMMKDRGIAGSKIEGNVQGDPGIIKKLRSKAAKVAGEGSTVSDRYDID